MRLTFMGVHVTAASHGPASFCCCPSSFSSLRGDLNNRAELQRMMLFVTLGVLAASESILQSLLLLLQRLFLSRKDLMLHKKGAGSNLNLLLCSVGTKFRTKRDLLMLRKEYTLAYAGVNQRAQPQRSVNHSWGNPAVGTCPGWQEHRERGSCCTPK